MNDTWHETLPVLDNFTQITDPSKYVPLPDDWCIGLSDVVNSSAAIEAGSYKSVNLAGVGTISAVANELNGGLRLFSFGGDGARFAVPQAQAQSASEALSRVAMWVKRDLDLELRVATISVAEIRTVGFDVRVAFWRASSHIQYAMFMGGGLEWAESQLKSGAISLAAADIDQEPNLTGLSCQWAPISAKNGKIISLIVRPAEGVAQTRFAETISQTIALLEEYSGLNPMPAEGPKVRWPAAAMNLQARIAARGRPKWLRKISVPAITAFIWLLFKTNIRLAGFDPSRYRREMAANTDFRKFDDSLMMTIDCNPDLITRIRSLLDLAVADGIVNYGLHVQNEALITCVAPSVHSSGHMHFVDGSGGGYAAAAAHLVR